MKILDMTPGQKCYTQLASCVLAVLVRREDGWRVYVNGVPGQNHDQEWQDVAEFGDKQKEEIVIAIVQNLFYPPFDPEGCPYAL
jgi:hypothetical protein